MSRFLTLTSGARRSKRRKLSFRHHHECIRHTCDFRAPPRGGEVLFSFKFGCCCKKRSEIRITTSLLKTWNDIETSSLLRWTSKTPIKVLTWAPFLGRTLQNLPTESTRARTNLYDFAAFTLSITNNFKANHERRKQCYGCLRLCRRCLQMFVTRVPRA